MTMFRHIRYTQVSKFTDVLNSKIINKPHPTPGSYTGVHSKNSSGSSSSKCHFDHGHGINEELELHLQMSDQYAIGR